MRQNATILGLALLGVVPLLGQPASAKAAQAPTVNQVASCNPTDAARLKALNAELADWADLNRYRAADEALGTPAKDVQRVVFLGDSITDFWGRYPNTGSFFPGKPYVNRGISGQTTPQMLVRFQQDVVQLHPAAVLILSGTNDIAGNTGPATPEMIEDNWKSMAAIATEAGIKVIFASITPALAYPWRPGIHPAQEIIELNQWLRQFCAAHGFVYLDYYDSMADRDGGMLPGLSRDGVHPTERGYAIMAPLAQQAIDEALAH